MTDFTLPEHPDAYKARLTELGVWDKCDRLFRKKYGQAVGRAAYGKPNKGKLTTQEMAECYKVAYDETYLEFPPALDGEPLKSLLDYVKEKRLYHKRDRKRRLSDLSAADERRFDEIGESDDHVGEVLWVYSNLDNRAVRACDSPSRGAWTMLAQYKPKRNRDAFYERMYRPVAQQLSKQKSAAGDDAYKPSKAEKLAVEELRTMLKESLADAAKWE